MAFAIPATTVHCNHCGVTYTVPIEPRLVILVRRCQECGQKALEIVADAHAASRDPPSGARKPAEATFNKSRARPPIWRSTKRQADH